ncbi:DUF726 domain-containing protein [Halorubrum saccharovorum]|uniref:DUF726 domain-containing protein n=1 Tax=Halorubrum saccharovorum TaxID=2248 RepID=UPI001F207B5F|nr:DUF726 domain-containing protein [Halorubrum saccharovorum]
MVTTRGRLDAADPTERSGSWDFDEADAVVLFVHGLGADAESARDQRTPPDWGSRWRRRRGGAGPRRPAGGRLLVGVERRLGAGEADRGRQRRPARRLADGRGRRRRAAGPPVRPLARRSGDGGDPPGTRRSRADRRPRLGLAVRRGDSGRQRRGRGTIRVAVAAVDAPVFNFHSRNDRVLDWVYRASDRTRAVGHGGLPASASPPAGYEDIDVTDSVADHYSYFQPEEGCLPRAIDRIGIE